MKEGSGIEIASQLFKIVPISNIQVNPRTRQQRRGRTTSRRSTSFSIMTTYSALKLVREWGKQIFVTRDSTGEARLRTFLTQRICIAIQKGNTIVNLISLPSSFSESLNYSNEPMKLKLNSLFRPIHVCYHIQHISWLNLNVNIRMNMLWFSGERWRGCSAMCILMENEFGFWENWPSSEETLHRKPLRKRSRGTIFWLYFPTDLDVW